MVMDRIKSLEEDLREAACVGDIETTEDLITKGININAKHSLNGWTALHWAAKRGNADVVKLLLMNGADPTITTVKGETALTLCTKSEIRKLIDRNCDECVEPSKDPSLPITPYYLKHPPLNGKVGKKSVGTGEMTTSTNTSPKNSSNSCQRCCNMSQTDELVLKVRVASTGDPDFIEVELPRADLTYSRLLRVCCEELGISATQVLKVRKLPDTTVRKDKDVQRFTDFQEVEIVTASTLGKNQVVPGANGSSNPNRYQSISLYKNQTILY